MNKSNITSNIEKSRNTSKQLEWYKRREDVVKKVDIMDVADNFSVFATRQQITRFIETYEYWKLIQNIPGNILECGVAGGNFLFSMAHFCSIYEPHHYIRNCIGFDTFEGFTSISKEDMTSNAKHMKAGGLRYESYEYLKASIDLYDQNRMIGNIPKIHLVKGDICSTLPSYLEKNPSSIISLLHLDLDLYAPTKVVLENALERMPKGAIVVFDELNHSDYPGETMAVMEVLGISNLKLKRLNEATTAAYATIS